MPWLKKDSRLRGHPKLIACAGALGVKPVYLQGHLDSMWLACLERYEDGDLTGLSNEQIAILAEWNTASADRFVELLKEYGWLDGCLIHDWLDYIGDFLKRKYRRSPEKLAEIYKKFGRESEILKKDTSGTRTGHVPDTSGTCIDIDKETTHIRSASQKLLDLGRDVVGLTCDALMDDWVNTWQEPWVIQALEKCRLKGMRGAEASLYAQGILRNWAKKGGPERDATAQAPPQSNQPRETKRFGMRLRDIVDQGEAGNGGGE